MIAWLFHWRFNRHDPAWQATGIRLTTPAHYDEALAHAGYLQSRRQSATGRVYRKAAKPQPAAVVRLRRRA